MKSILSLLFCLLLTSVSFAQNESNTSKHLTFKEVSIDGTLIEFVSKMENEGFTHLRTEEGIATLNGDFATYKDCRIAVLTIEPKEVVHSIQVFFPKCYGWSSLLSNYMWVKELLTEKYGEPTLVVETFNKPTVPDENNAKMWEVLQTNCNYSVLYEMEEGTIELTIKRGTVVNAFVQITYLDKINGEMLRQKAKDDL